MELTARNVKELMSRCLPAQGQVDPDTFELNDPPEGFLVVSVVDNTYILVEESVKAKDEDIKSLLDKLPKEYHEDGGKFEEAVKLPNGKYWTSNLKLVDQLVALGVAAGRAKFTTERDTWDFIKNGYPYFVVMEKQEC